MLPELGHFSLILAFILAIMLALVPMLGATLRWPGLMAFARPLATGQFVFLLLSFACLVKAFLDDDFTLLYVASNSNSLLPWYFKFSAVWGGHEGSILLWVLMLAGWTLAVAAFSRNLPADMIARVLSVMGFISVGFQLFILATSNPFARNLLNPPSDGADLNPLLQDIGLIIHPPMLYMGYVGFSVAFAFAIAALLSGRLDAAWARWSRPWTTVAWSALTLGIALGSWWAYYELGWGGWWFWDPVENASFMPWLAGTALMHSLAVTEKRGIFKSWTVLLAMLAFLLSLLGTFLVRSGVLTSVHAFANDPERGLFILGFLGIVLVGALTLFALRAPVVRSHMGFGSWSREIFLLLNNVLLLAATFLVLLGTLIPLLFDALGLGKISVGPPFFNTTFVPLALAAALLMGAGIFSRWKRTDVNKLLPGLMAPAGLSLLLAGLLPLIYGSFRIWAFLGCLAASWILFTTLRDLWDKSAHPSGRWQGIRRLSRSYVGMLLGHLGLAVTIAGASVVSNYGIERDIRMLPGDQIEIAGYAVRLKSINQVEGVNFMADEGAFEVYRGQTLIANLFPQKRIYRVQRSGMTEAGIDAGLMRDLFIALGEPLEDGAWAVRIQYKPMVRWLWLGAILMALGGLLAIADRRYRLKAAATEAATAHAAQPGVQLHQGASQA